MAQAFPSDDPFLQRGFEPIQMECDYADLVVEGELPAELDGSLYRIGPNPQFAPRGRYNPLLADGMIHAFQLANGTVAYRNRWVRTRQWQLERAAGRALFGTSGNPADADPAVAGVPSDGVANTNLVWHGGKLLALEEGHAPLRVDPQSLDTLGPWTFAGQLPANMTAHPKLDPETGELLFFANFPNRDSSGGIAFYVADARGELVRSERLRGPFPALVHDFAVTKEFVVFVVCPLTLSIERLRAGGPPIAWEPERGTHLGVFPRAGKATEARWYRTEACMVWHALNAWNEGSRLVIDVCSQQAAAFPRSTGELPREESLRQYLTRMTLDFSTEGGVAVEEVSDVVCEYPRIDERRTGLAHGYGFFACAGGPGTGDLFHRGIARFDFASKEMQVYHAGARRAVAEPVFVPRHAEAPEGVGYLLTPIFDEERNKSHLAVFDAEHVERGPLARAFLDHRVPLGFHGIWRQNEIAP